MINIELADFQIEVFDFVNKKIRENEKRILIYMPVGSGKSTVIKAIIEKLLQDHYPSTIGLLLPGIAITDQYYRILRGPLSAMPFKFEVNRKSLTITPSDKDEDSESAIYIVDDSFNAGVISILKRQDTIVIGFYAHEDDKVIKAYGKEKADFAITDTQLLQLVNTDASTPESQLNSILKKLSIPNDSKRELSTALSLLDLWANEYVSRQSQSKNDDEKFDLLKTMVIRKEALDSFHKLLNDKKYFSSIQKNGSEEKVWQVFFEKNKWIFGLNLNLYLLSSLNNKKYEQVVAGYTFSSGGKRVDGLLKSNGLMSSFHFCEIKTDTTKILQSGTGYRVDSFSISAEFAGAIAQTQKTVFKAMQDIRSKLTINDDDGYNTDEIVYNYLPQATIVIGSLNEFMRDNKINEERYASFELFRKSLVNIQVITFDELFARAKAVLGIAQQEL